MIRAPTGFLLLAVAGPLAAQPRQEFTELHMGVAVRLVLHAEDSAAARGAARAAFQRIAALEQVFSDYRAGSEVRQLAVRAGPDGRTPVSQELFTVLAAARQVAEVTGGAFDPTIAPLVALWRESRRSGRLPESARVDSARSLVDWRLLELDSARRTVRFGRPGMQLDLGGIAKGYILGQALGVLRQHGAAAALIEAGGDIVLGDPPPGRDGWDIGLDGSDPGPLSGVAIATSGTGEQFVEIGGVRYAHLVDPRTGLGLTHPAQVTIIGPDPAVADALATALAVLGPGAESGILAAFPGYRAVITHRSLPP